MSTTRPAFLCSAILALLLGGCTAGPEADPGPDGQLAPSDGAAPGADARPPGAVCDPLQQRTPAPELFVGPTGLEQRLVERIQGARKTIDVLMYEITRAGIFDAFIAAQKRGVAIRVIIDRGRDTTATTKARLAGAGIQVHESDARFPYMHAKIVLVDGVEGVVMSANMDEFSMDRARNYGIVDRDPADLADLHALFEADWAGAPDPDVSCTRLLISPLNSSRRLGQLISAAKKQLDMQVMYLGDRDLIAATKARITAGVPVRILLATPNFVSGNDVSAKDLLAAGAQVKYFYNNHAKLVLSDGVAFVGSENLSYTSLSKNREVGVFVTEAAAAAVASKQFELDWKSGVTP